MDSSDIAGHLRQASEVTIILGAGASVRAGIPLAGALVKQINKNYPHCVRSLSEEERGDYGRVMASLSPGDRKDLIEPLLQNSKVNWGHIALACIIKHCNVSRILTFNFDLVLERAASLMGMHLPVYDFAVAPTDNIAGLATPAIVHLHGQSYALRLMNSDEETNGHAKKLSPLITDSLRNHVTIVAGYSGQADAMLPLMTEAFNEQHHLIWLGHDENAGAHLAPLLKKKYATYVGGCDSDITMIDVGRELGCFPSEVIRNPPEHIFSELQDVTDFPVQSETDFDILTDTRKRLKSAASQWEQDTGGLGQSQQALLSGRVENVDDPEKLSHEERKVRAWSLVDSGVRLANKAETASGRSGFADFSLAYKKFAEAIRIMPEMHQAYYNWGVALAREAELLVIDTSNAKFTEIIKIYVEACEKYAEALRIKPDKLEAIQNWTVSLLKHATFLQGDDKKNKCEEAKDKALLEQKYTWKVSYNLPCAHALLDEQDEALEFLERCLVDGTLPSLAHLKADGDLESLRDTPGFDALLAKLKE